ncbi:MAG: hypothetical protein V4598_02710 [Bdellovibrionota bacterium]
MKAIFLMSILVLSFNLFADEELPVIGGENEEEILAVGTATENAADIPAPESQVLQARPINVDGYYKEKQPEVSDPELQTIKAEIVKQKQAIVLNKVKAKEFKELGKSTEQLSETTEEMLLEKRAVQEEIANYNLKVKCMSEEHPGPDCDKFNKKRR